MRESVEHHGRTRRTPRARPALALLAAVAVVLTGCKTGGDDEDATDPSDTTAPASALPLIYQEAVEQGREDDVEWGDGCDPETGRLKVPIANAAPCIEPWDDTQDNGGATSQGVTADEIVIALYKGQPDPLQQALVEDEGAEISPDAGEQAARDYLAMFADVYETYGRTLRIETIEATGGPADATAALADAQKVLDLKPFAAIGGPVQTPVYWQELTNAGVVCVGLCSLAETNASVEAAAPYLWPTGPSPEQGDLHLIELIGKQLAGKPAEYAGDPALHSQERVFGFVQASTELGEYDARNDAMAQALQEEYGVELAARSSFVFDLTRAQENATTVVARMKDAGVTTVVVSTDPFTPKYLTEEATKQEYSPEWVIGPTVLVDTTFFGRTYDQQQWAHAFGLSQPTARADNSVTDPWNVYSWYFGTEPPLNTVAVLWGGPARLLLGVHLAGPDLTPETFRDGLFRYPPDEPGKTYSHESWGTDGELWPFSDYNGGDDVAVIWWDADVTGEDENGNEGPGMLRYVDGGTRHLPGRWPTEPLPLFEEEGTVTVYEELPESDVRPDYPPWPGSPAAG